VPYVVRTIELLRLRDEVRAKGRNGIAAVLTAQRASLFETWNELCTAGEAHNHRRVLSATSPIGRETSTLDTSDR